MNKKYFLSIIISLFVIILQSFIALFIAPLVTSTVGIEAYGFVSLAKDFTDYANIIMIALNSYATRYISLAYLENDIKKFKCYYSTVFIADLFIGGFILLLGAFFAVFLECSVNVSIELVDDVKILFLLTFFSFFLTTLSTVFITFAFIKDKVEIYNLIKVISYLTQIATLIVCFSSKTFKIWFIGGALCLTSLTLLIGTYLMTIKYLSEAKIKTKDFSIYAFKVLLKNGIWNSINTLGNALNSGLDLLITNLMISAVGMGQISIAKTINSFVTFIYSIIGMHFHPKLLKKFSENDQNSIIAILKGAMKCCGIVTNTIYACFIAIGHAFLTLWIPNQDTDLIYTLCVLALLPSISEGCVCPLYYIYTLTVKNKVPCYITIIGGLLNVVSMYVLIKHTELGIYAVLITTAMIMNFINLVTNPLYMTYCLKINKYTFYPQIIRNFISLLFAISSTILTIRILPCANSWLLFFLDVCILGLEALFIQIPIQFNQKELKQILSSNIKP